MSETYKDPEVSGYFWVIANGTDGGWAVMLFETDSRRWCTCGSDEDRPADWWGITAWRGPIAEPAENTPTRSAK